MKKDKESMSDMDLDIVNSTLNEIGSRIEKKWTEGLTSPSRTDKEAFKKYADELGKRKDCMRDKLFEIEGLSKDKKINLDNLMNTLLNVTREIEDIDFSKCSNH